VTLSKVWLFPYERVHDGLAAARLGPDHVETQDFQVGVTQKCYRVFDSGGKGRCEGQVYGEYEVLEVLKQRRHNRKQRLE